MAIFISSINSLCSAVHRCKASIVIAAKSCHCHPCGFQTHSCVVEEYFLLSNILYKTQISLKVYNRNFLLSLRFCMFKFPVPDEYQEHEENSLVKWQTVTFTICTIHIFASQLDYKTKQHFNQNSCTLTILITNNTTGYAVDLFNNVVRPQVHKMLQFEITSFHILYDRLDIDQS